MWWLEGALAAIGSGGAFVGGLSGLAAFARRRYTLPRSPDAVVTAKTIDSWPLQVLHYRPTGPAFAEPIILCHGLAANSYNLDFDDRYSLARYLARRGFHAFVPDLRGRQGSWPDRARWRQRHDYTFDDHAGLDAPAILQTALDHANASRAFWIGHSMGGMIGYVLAGREIERIAGLITLGSPTHLKMDQLLGKIVELALSIPFDPIPQRIFAQALAPLMSQRFPPFPDISAVRANMDTMLIRRALANVVVDLPRRLIRQFTDWAWKEQPISMHGGVNYLDAIARVRAPLLCVAATGDRLAGPDLTRPGYELVRSDDKRWLCLGSGIDDPFAGRSIGHVDMVLGRDAPDLFFPIMAKWLEERATRTTRRTALAAS